MDYIPTAGIAVAAVLLFFLFFQWRNERNSNKLDLVVPPFESEPSKVLCGFFIIACSGLAYLFCSFLPFDKATDTLTFLFLLIFPFFSIIGVVYFILHMVFGVVVVASDHLIIRNVRKKRIIPFSSIKRIEISQGSAWITLHASCFPVSISLTFNEVGRIVQFVRMSIKHNSKRPIDVLLSGDEWMC